MGGHLWLKNIVRLVMNKRLLVYVLVLSVFCTSAQSATNLVFDTKGNIIGSYVEGNAASYSKMQASLSGVYYKKAGEMGYTPVSQAGGAASWSPKVTATIDAVSGVAGTTAATVTGVLLAGATAPGWIGIAVVAGISAVVGYAVNLGIGSLARWLFRSDGKVDIPGGSLNSPAAISVGGSYWFGSLLVGPGSTNVTIYGGDGRAMAHQSEVNTRKYLGISTDNLTCTLSESSPPYWSCGSYGSQIYFRSSGAPISCGYGMYCTATSSFESPAISSPSKTAVPLQTAIADIPAADKTKPLSPVIVAAIANKMWSKAASQPGYQGMPYSYANPITEQDVKDWQTANPTQYPTVQDFIQPMTSGSTTGSPWSLPVSGQPVGTTNGTPTAPTGTTNPGSSNPLQNLGPDPGIASPSLEVTPTAQTILAPILGLFPDLRSYSAPSHVGECPKPSLDLWSKHLVLDGHCSLLDNNRAAIQAVMAAVWVMLALFIILAA